MTPIEAELITQFWSDNDFRIVKDVCESYIRCKPEDLFKVMILESDMDPTRQYPRKAAYPDAVGLNQLTSVAALEAGLIKSKSEWPALAKQILAMPVGLQLYLVARYFMGVPYGKTGKAYDATKLYQSNYQPYSLPEKTKPTDVLAVKGTAVYDNNAGLDMPPQDGKITVGDLTIAIESIPSSDRISSKEYPFPAKRIYEAAVLRYHAVNGPG